MNVYVMRQSARFLSVDPSHRLLDYSSPDIPTPNRLEALALAELFEKPKSFQQTEVVEKIFDRYSSKMLAITLSGYAFAEATR